MKHLSFIFYKILKRLIDILLAFIGLVFFSPLLLIAIFLVWIQDFNSPFYVADRVGRNHELFKMVKIRSMVKNADEAGIDSTSSEDMRITKVGKFIRRFKLDEITQLWNVLIGTMTLVGPRPNVKRETDLYTKTEKELLTLKPGITDFASIVFADEGEILSNYENPDIAYNQLIRPSKSKLGLFYIGLDKTSVDLLLILLTIGAIVSRRKTLKLVSGLLKYLKADLELIEIASRKKPLIPSPPPGSTQIIQSRDIGYN
jgi:lipopolysaccharide/colanic/teichoic acid biosynthesis glycosyltransferase